MIPLGGLVSTVITLIIIGLVFWLLWWLIGYCNPPEPFKKIANVVLAIAAVIAIIGLLLSMINGQPMFR